MTKAEAAEQFARFSVFGNAYRDLQPRDVEEYIAAMMTAPSVERARKFVSDWIQNQEWLPKVAQVVAAFQMSLIDWQALETNEKRAVWKSELISKDCPYCQDYGVRDITGVWEWCSCATGATRRVTDPHIVDEANAALTKLRTRFPEVAAAIAKAMPQ